MGNEETMKTTTTTDLLNNSCPPGMGACAAAQRLVRQSKTKNGASANSSLAIRAGAILLMALSMLMTAPTSANDHRPDVGGKRDIAVMTRNLYVGADFGTITDLDPTDPDYLMNLVGAVTTVYYTIVVQNDFRIRAEAIADENVAKKPDLVGLQEVSAVTLHSPGAPGLDGATPTSVVVVDYLEVLLEALAVRGAHYAAVSMVTNLDAELPFMNLGTGVINYAQLTDHDVILARTDLPPGYLRLKNHAQGNFETNLVFPAIGLELRRGWCSVDASVRGRTFRFINTHLEEETSPEIQWLQAQELLAGPAHVSMPVILVGDCNTDGNRQNGTVTYDGLLRAGFRDAWNATHRCAPGLTWGHDPFLADPTVPFVWRIDLILFKGKDLVPVKTDIFDTQLPRAQPPFWPSDHAGVVSRFLVK